MGSIRQEEDKLFAEWKTKRLGFRPDGIVDETKYLSSSIKILFILKELNKCDDDFDLREFLKKGGRPETWDNITRWTKGIRHLKDDLTWDIELKEITENSRIKYLKSIAAMNIKKIPGGHTADNKSLWQVATEDSRRIDEQFHLYQPNIAICCGSTVSDVMAQFVLKTDEWKFTKHGVRYIWHKIQGNNNSTLIINYLHPKARVGRNENLLFYGLIDAIKELYPNN